MIPKYKGPIKLNQPNGALYFSTALKKNLIWIVTNNQVVLEPVLKQYVVQEPLPVSLPLTGEAQPLFFSQC